jgi:hypothetical protein
VGIDAGQIWVELIDPWRDHIRIEWRGIRMHASDFKWWFEFVDLQEIALVWLPVWLFILLTGVPTAWLFRRDWKRGRIERAHLCPKCGYNLRGQLADGCPECGWGREENAQMRKHANAQSPE